MAKPKIEELPNQRTIKEAWKLLTEYVVPQAHKDLNINGKKLTPLSYDDENNLFPIICDEGVIMVPATPVLKAYPEHAEKLIELVKTSIIAAREKPLTLEETAKTMGVTISQ